MQSSPNLGRIEGEERYTCREFGNLTGRLRPPGKGSGLAALGQQATGRRGRPASSGVFSCWEPWLLLAAFRSADYMAGREMCQGAGVQKRAVSALLVSWGG